jgi:xanthine dehydrogenase accessory factor
MNICPNKSTASLSADPQQTSLIQEKLVVIRGAGDIATGVAARLYNCGFQVIMVEIALPTMIRCTVSFGQCLYGAPVEVEGITAVKATSLTQIDQALKNKQIPVMVDEQAQLAEQLGALYLIDAILAKRNMGLAQDMAPITVALGPGFNAGTDCDAVIETNRGHHLGRVIYQGPTQANTGVPGNIAGFTHERVFRAPCSGVMQSRVKIGELVEQGQLIAHVSETPVYAPLAGMVRGLLNNDLAVTQGFKIGDIDPRGQHADYTTISDKARAIGGSVLEAMLHLAQKRS